MSPYIITTPQGPRAVIERHEGAEWAEWHWLAAGAIADHAAAGDDHAQRLIITRYNAMQAFSASPGAE